MTKVAVLGTGSWGTTFAQVIADAGHEVVMWGRNAEVVAEINAQHTNSRYVADLALSATVSATTDAATALDGAQAVVLAVPSQTLRDNVQQWPTLPEVPLVSVMKGIEAGTDFTMSQVIADATGAPASRIAVVSGPNLAVEIAQKQPCASTVACIDEATAHSVASLCDAPYFRPYVTTDVIGVEIGGAVKNVIALAVGIARGLGAGDNTKASLITRGLAEISRLGVALGANPVTFQGLAGMGDLVATCASELSRNNRVGMQLGKGLSVADAVKNVGQTAEGVKSCKAVLDLAITHGVDMPITEFVVAIVHKGLPATDMAKMLLRRPLRNEHSSKS